MLDANGAIIKEEKALIKRTILWRPFIIDLWDTRLPRGQSRTYTVDYSIGAGPQPAAAEVIVRYYLVDEKRRRRIGYENTDPVSYEVFRQRVSLDEAG